MALKCYATFKGFDALEDFYEEKVSGTYVIVENFQRSYCNTCGKVTATLNDACTCGATKFRRIHDMDYYSRRRLIDSKISTEYNPTTDMLKVSAKLLKFNDGNRDEFEVMVENADIISFGKHKYVIHNKDLLREVSSKVFEEYPYKDELLNYSLFWNYQAEADKELSVQTAINVIDALNTAPNLIEDPDCMRFKYLMNRLIRNNKITPSMNMSFRKNLETRRASHKHFEILNRFAKNCSYYSSTYEIFEGSGTYYSWGSHGSKQTYSEFLKDQEAKYSKAKGHIWPVIHHHLMSGAINLDDFCIILENYNFLYTYDAAIVKGTSGVDMFAYQEPLRKVDTFVDFFKKDYLDLFPVYVRENLYGKPTRELVQHFCRDLYLMTKYSIPIDEDSIKLKNFNYNLNERNLSETLGISSEKIEVFLDTFDRNPLASVTLLRDRRKLTKKQMEEYMELLDKDM